MISRAELIEKAFKTNDNYDKTRWNFTSGDPELYRYKDTIIKAGGWALDLGSAQGRNAVPLVMMGMNVIGIDTRDFSIGIFNDVARHVRKLCGYEDIAMRALSGNVLTTSFGVSEWDLILVSELFIHFRSHSDVLSVLSKSYDALKEGGHLWFRAIGTEDSEYEDLKLKSEKDPSIKDSNDDHVFWTMCGCSGTIKLEPILFINPTDIVTVMYSLGFKIIHLETIPVKGDANVMYGEDWLDLQYRDYSYFCRRRGMISILARKD